MLDAVEEKGAKKRRDKGSTPWYFSLKERNKRTFRSTSTTSAALVAKIVNEANEWLQAGYRHLRSLIVLL
jgi:hypothetical protein